MKNTSLLLLGIFALFGVFLLRGGVTGLTIADACIAQGTCPDVSATIQGPAYLSPEDNSALSVVGLMIIIISAALVFGYMNLKKIREKHEKEAQ